MNKVVERKTGAEAPGRGGEGIQKRVIGPHALAFGRAVTARGGVTWGWGKDAKKSPNRASTPPGSWIERGS